MAATTTGVIKATIVATETISELGTLSADNVTNELSITIRTADTDVTAEQLNNISNATSLNVDASNVTSITGTVTELVTL